MKALWFAAAALALWGSSAAALADEAVSCEWSHHYAGGASDEGAVTIALDAAHITGLNYETSTASGQEGGGYFCSFDSANPALGKVSIEPVEHGVKFVSDVGTPAPVFTVIWRKGRYWVSAEFTSPFCGFGAGFVEVQVVPGRKGCGFTKK